ncbi:MAG TPA: hypothetical protein VHB21_20895 [Minicystis sp.]|nr:hypothetical protein [Minicystis sp.]
MSGAPAPHARARLGRRAAALALSLGACLAQASSAAASPEDVFGFGARSSAMGATGAALGEGYEAVYANPALLSLTRERELTLGFQGAIFDLHANGARSYEPLRGSVIGATLPVPFDGPLANRVVLGVGFFTPFDLVVRGRILYETTPQFLLPDRTQSVAVQAAVGVDVGHGVRVGGGFAALAALSGSVEVATDASGRIGTVVGDTLLASYAPVVGASLDLGKAWRLGAVFRGELVGRFDVRIDVKDLGSITVPPLDISGVPQYDPLEVALGIARVDGPLRAEIELVYKHWSAYPGAEAATVRCPVLDPATGMPFTGECTAPSPPPPRFSDTVSPHVGLERRFELRRGVTVAVRGGAFFEPTPAPAQTRASNVYDEARVGLSAGYGLRLGAPLPPVSLDAFVQGQALVPRTHDKAAGVARENPGYPSVATSGAIGAAGVTAGVRF